MSERSPDDNQLRNPFRRVISSAGIVMPGISWNQHVRLTEAAPGALGAIDPGALALFGMALADHHAARRGKILETITRWVVPAVKGKIGSVTDIEVARTDRGMEGALSTIVRMHAVPLTGAVYRTGVCMQVDSVGDKIYGAGVALTEQRPLPSSSPGVSRGVEHVTLASLWLDSEYAGTLDEHGADALPATTYAQQLLPLAAEGGRLLAEVVAAPEMAHKQVVAYGS